MTEQTNTLEQYSVPELVEAFESIDDRAYPERAKAIYTLLLSKSNSSPRQLAAEYDNGPVLDAIGALPLMSAVAADWQLSNQQTSEKIARITTRQNAPAGRQEVL